MIQKPTVHRCAGLVLATLVTVLTGGCLAISDLPAPGRILEQQTPETGREYYVYVPSTYTADRPWSMVVACHGTRPFDSADLQLTEWKGVAEQKSFLLVVPQLKGTRGDFAPPVAEQVHRQLEDEAAILSAVRNVKAAYNVDDSRVFLTGWSAGGYAVLFTGLRNPDVFRALAPRQTNFDPAFVEMCVPYLDRMQPILVMYGSLDPLRDGATACIDWLRAHEFEPETLERPGTHKRDPMPIYNFFAQVVRHKPWVRIQVKEDPEDPMKISLGVKTSFEPVKYLWDLGDGSERLPVATLDYRYSKPGLYNIRVGVWRSDSEKDRYVRQVQLQVPRIRLGTVPNQ